MAYSRLQQHPKAIPDWDNAIELSPKTRYLIYRAMRVTSLITAGQVAKAVIEVEELTKTRSWTNPVWYNFACIYAAASKKTPGKQ